MTTCEMIQTGGMEQVKISGYLLRKKLHQKGWSHMDKNPIEVLFPGDNELTAILPKGASVTLEGPVRGATITCKTGAAWIVQHGDRRDHVLEAGWDFEANGRGQIFVRIMRDARITIKPGDRSEGGFLLSSSDRRGCEASSGPRWSRCFLASRRQSGRSIRITVARSSPDRPVQGPRMLPTGQRATALQTPEGAAGFFAVVKCSI